MPLGKTIDFTVNPYKDLRDIYRVNIFNKTDPFFTDRCFVYQYLGFDVPVNSRKDLIFPNITSSCGFSCSLLGMDINGTVECSCTNPSKVDMGDLVQGFEESFYKYIYSSSNFMIAICNVNNDNKSYNLYLL